MWSPARTRTRASSGHSSLGEPTLDVLGGRERGAGRLERGEELVAPRVDDDAALGRDRVADGRPDAPEHVAPVLAEIGSEPRRALDVDAEEGDGAGREGRHGANAT